MRDIKCFPKIMLCVDCVDFRKGMRSLSALVEGEYGVNVFDGSLFIFTNRSKDAAKMLYWDRTGFALWHKILDQDRFRWPKNLEEKSINISAQELEWLLDGIDLRQLKRHDHLHYSSVG